ncbi:hypothetical protein [Halomonas sp. ANAO-440]|uniref:hypothetical protein n=1 Tax=Halomonas sp. ANAO-440 TaxID=2861360 RepID=UPI0039776134
MYYPNVNYILRLLSPGGVIICDNAISHKSELMNFMSYFTNQESFSTTLLPIGKGEYVVYKPS